MLHGALIDAELLADVYIELTGGRQIGFDLAVSASVHQVVDKVSWPVREFAVPAEDRAAHAAFVDAMKEPLWRKFDQAAKLEGD